MKRGFAIATILIVVVGFAFSGSPIKENAQIVPPEPVFTSITM